jgi:hypothetical protein
VFGIVANLLSRSFSPSLLLFPRLPVANIDRNQNQAVAAASSSTQGFFNWDWIASM